MVVLGSADNALNVVQATNALDNIDIRTADGDLICLFLEQAIPRDLPAAPKLSPVAVSGAMLGNFYSTGQVCSNGTRVFVQRGVVEPVTVLIAFDEVVRGAVEDRVEQRLIGIQRAWKRHGNARGRLELPPRLLLTRMRSNQNAALP